VPWSAKVYQVGVDWVGHCVCWVHVVHFALDDLHPEAEHEVWEEEQELQSEASVWGIEFKILFFNFVNSNFFACDVEEDWEQMAKCTWKFLAQVYNRGSVTPRQGVYNFTSSV
jgi:hypothetical protein